VPARIDSREHRRHLIRGIVVLALGLGALTACGGSGDAATTASTSAAATTTAATASSPGSGGESQVQAITATEGNFSITLDREDLAPGTYEITVLNKGRSTHDLAVEKDGSTEATSDKLAPGESTTLTVDLDDGEYVFYCSVGNHRAMGMEITVQVS
jgi:plastocyanin